MKKSEKVINPLKGVTDRSWFFEQQVYDPKGLTRAVKSTDGSGNVPKVIVKNMENQNTIDLPEELKGKKFRIRKLTPRECFRLMDVDDADIDKIQATSLSNSAQYRLAGNSICVGVLYHILRKLLVEPEPDIEKEQQLSLF